MRRLFNPSSGRCLDIAIDHGFFGEAAFLPGIEDLRSAVDTLAAAEPDAIQLTVGQARLLQQQGGRERPALVLRTDIANVYGSPLPDHMFDLIIPEPGLAGVRLDATCVVVNLFDLPGQPRVREACIRAVLEAKKDCERYNMPLMVEPLVMKATDNGGYGVNGDVSKIVPLVRQAVELGADIIKADPTDNPDDYHEVIRIATGIPVLVRGGGRVADDELFRRTEAVLAQGASGIVYGRNIIQHPNPTGMTRALMAMLHEGVDAAGAGAILAGS
ncbi:MAG: aldolase [Actinobacteria bacterium]|nr:aldolase [Actinomycetota bacterium]